MAAARRVQRTGHNRFHRTTAHQALLHRERVHARCLLLDRSRQFQEARDALQLSQRELQVPLDRRRDALLPLAQAEELVLVLDPERVQIAFATHVSAEPLVELRVGHRSAGTTLPGGGLAVELAPLLVEIDKLILHDETALAADDFTLLRVEPEIHATALRAFAD